MLQYNPIDSVKISKFAALIAMQGMSNGNLCSGNVFISYNQNTGNLSITTTDDNFKLEYNETTGNLQIG